VRQTGVVDRIGRLAVKRLVRSAAVKETLIYSSPRRRPGSSALIFLDSGTPRALPSGRFRRNDDYRLNQRFPSGLLRNYRNLTAGNPCGMKTRLSRRGVVAHPRHSYGDGCGSRLATERNPSFSSGSFTYEADH
jgi:hypothetical protein